MWHREVITEAVERTLRDLQQTSLLERFYLAGGTGLALHIGHRRSIDLDFFSRDAFDPEAILGKAESLEGLHVLSKDPETLHLTIGETKVSFLGYRYPLLFPCEEISEVKVADPRDIACMKVSAIASRGTKRDFVDLYVSAGRFGLANILEWFDRKYAQTHHNKLHVLKSLTFFDDAEKDPMAHMLAPLAWEEVKRFFVHGVPPPMQ